MFFISIAAVQQHLKSSIGRNTGYNLRMNDPAAPDPSPTTPPGHSVLFASEGPNGHGPMGTAERNWMPWIVAAIVILVILALAFFSGGHRGGHNASAAVDPYAAQLAVSNVQLSQASNFAGDQLTYVDGTITNRGTKTVTAITVRVLFPNDDGEPPQAEQLPVNMIRTREPYVDTESVGAAPLKPGATQDFRLVFDDVSGLWNQQLPTIKIASVVTRP
jgi:hypothetical protein